MVKACDLKKQHVIDIDGAPHCVENISLQSPTARGGSTIYKVRFRNVTTKAKIDKTYRGEDPLQETSFEARPVSFEYKSGDIYSFMDLDTYETIELPGEEIGDILPFLIEGMEGITALTSGEKVLTLRLPDTVEMEIIECPPSMKGASATSRNKPATMSTGLVVQVPEYIEPGEIIRIDTRERKYLSRA